MPFTKIVLHKMISFCPINVRYFIYMRTEIDGNCREKGNKKIYNSKLT